MKILRCIKQVLEIVNEPSCYPEMKRKSYLMRIYDQLLWGLKYRAINVEYNFYGMDIEGLRQDYLDKKTFERTRDKINGLRHNKKGYNHAILLADKYVFYNF